LIEDGGRIIHITSIHYERVARGSSAYGMAKAAITQLTRSLAVELAHRNILANTVAPGFIDTPMSVKADGKNELESEWFEDNYIKYNHLPLKRAGQPEEVAGVVYFLAGPDASYMTGSVVTVDGGLMITF
jgi:3-oxoacyl-[acyl-carrier protein] reductase